MFPRVPAAERPPRAITARQFNFTVILFLNPLRIRRSGKKIFIRVNFILLYNTCTYIITRVVSIAPGNSSGQTAVGDLLRVRCTGSFQLTNFNDILKTMNIFNAFKVFIIHGLELRQSNVFQNRNL